VRPINLPSAKCAGFGLIESVNDLTRILHSIEQGDPKAAEELLPLVYDELRKLAAARMAHLPPGQTLQPTALVHEAYVRLLGSDQQRDNRGHFFAAAAEAMRRILVAACYPLPAARPDGDPLPASGLWRHRQWQCAAVLPMAQRWRADCRRNK